MEIFQATWLALIQGLTEFLPISSSAHLILPSKLLGWPDQGLAFDVAVHVGTLVAVMAYFRSDLVQLTRGGLESLRCKSWNAEAKLLVAVGIGVIPAGLVGSILGSFIEYHLRSTLVIALTTIGFGLLLGWADLRCRAPSRPSTALMQVGYRQALLIGLAQAFALIPGTSRSGVTITAALLLGFDRNTAARFSFLLSIPLIFAAGAMKSLELVQQAEPVNWAMILYGSAVAGGSAYVCIHWFLKLLDQIGMMPFVVYRLFLGGGLLALWATLN